MRLFWMSGSRESTTSLLGRSCLCCVVLGFLAWLTCVRLVIVASLGTLGFGLHSRPTAQPASSVHLSEVQSMQDLPGSRWIGGP